MNRHSPSVGTVLARTGAQLRRTGSAGRGLVLADWSNSDNHASYDQPNHHTLSIYLKGGERVVREDKRLSGGAPGKLCLLPAGHESRWHIGGPLEMFHLYVDPDILAYQALAAFDIDPRQLDLMDLTFADDPYMATVVRDDVLPRDWTADSERMALSSACHLLIHRVLSRHTACAIKEVRGGLAASARRGIVDYVEAHLDRPLTLDDLAAEARLSTFHFAKMFRVSFGLPPHRYVAERRAERAKNLLGGTPLALAQIAQACGYASQSHFTRAFKNATGLTPGAWRSFLR